ncbi:MAG: hypothetical protein O3B24_08080 [Verrucomicrobia bacterium]|nr:hypothetical protein [Verrucomicrobiota bacterium]
MSKELLTNARVTQLRQDNIGPDVEFLSVKPVFKNRTMDGST